MSFQQTRWKTRAAEAQVVDNAAMDNPFKTYEEYSPHEDQNGVTQSKIQTQLAGLLTQEIFGPLFSGFPMKCKLIEICMIGRKNNG